MEKPLRNIRCADRGQQTMKIKNINFYFKFNPIIEKLFFIISAILILLTIYTGSVVLLVLFFIVAFGAVSYFKLSARKKKQFSKEIVQLYLPQIKSTLGEGLSYLYYGDLQVDDIINDPSVSPWSLEEKESYHILKGVFNKLEFSSANFITYKYDNERMKYDDFKGYYIVASGLSNDGIKLQIRTRSYYDSFSSSDSELLKKINKRNTDNSYIGVFEGNAGLALIKTGDYEFDEKFIVTSNNAQKAAKLIGKGDLIQTILRMPLESISIFIHGNGQISIAIKRFEPYVFEEALLSDDIVKNKITQDTEKIRDCLVMLESLICNWKTV